MRGCCTDLLSECRVTHLTPLRVHGSRHEAHCLRFAQKHSHHIAQCRTSRHTWWNQARALLPHLSWTLFERAQTLRRSTSTAEWRFRWPRPFAGCEPKQLTEDQDYKHFTEDWQLIEHEDLRVKPLSFHQSIIASTYDSAESIATPPPQSDLDDEQLRALLASPLYVQEREACAEHSQVYQSERENLMSSSSQDPTTGGAGKLVALFSSHNRLNQETFSDREEFSLRHQQVFRSNESFFTFSNRTNVAKSLLDGNKRSRACWSEMWTHESGIQSGIS